MKRLDIPAGIAAVFWMTVSSQSVALAVTNPETPDAVRILALARAATGGSAWDPIKNLHHTAKRQTGDVTATEDVWTDMVRGRVAFSLTDPSGTERWGVDGKTVWVQQPDYPPAPADAQTRQRLTAEAFWRGYGWVRPVSAGTNILWLKEETRGGHEFDVVRITPVGGASLEISFDKASHLPVRIETAGTTGTEIIRLAEWRKFHEISIPGRIDVDTVKTGDHFEETIGDLTRAPATDSVRFDMPIGDPVDVNFPAGASSVETPIKISGDHVLLVGKIAKSKLRWRLDSASSSVIDQRLVQTLGLDVGPGANPTARLPELSIGGVRFRHQLFDVRDMTSATDNEGMQIDGILGADFLTHLIIELDYDGRRIVLVKPEAFVPPPAAASLAIIMIAKGAAIETRIDGISALLTLDTASDAGIVLNPEFVAAHGFEARWHLVPALLNVGGETDQAMIGRAGSIELGVLGAAQPIVTIPRSAIGQTDGSIGGATLRHFDVIFDYPQKRLFLQETANSNRPDPVDHAGMWLTGDPDSLDVAGIAKDGPAAKAGIRVGDKIRSIDGEKITSTSLVATRAMLKGVPGSGFTFAIDRNGTEKSVRVILADPLFNPPSAP